MKIVHVSTNDVTGGAARSAYRLHEGLCRQGENSFLFVARAESNDTRVTVCKINKNPFNGLRRLLQQGWFEWRLSRYQSYNSSRCGLFSDIHSKYDKDLIKNLPECQLINIHWITGFLDYHTFFKTLDHNIPIVWTLHDMNPFTGGCHYDHFCARYIEHCGACPQLGSNIEFDLSYKIFASKQKIFKMISPKRLHIVTPSLWLANEVKKSRLFQQFPVSIIPYGLDVKTFSPRKSYVAREAFEISQEAYVILFVAHLLAEHRKGFNLLIQSLKELRDLSNLHLISVGMSIPSIDISIPYQNLGHINNDRLLSLVYSVADVFVIPSEQDNLPNTILESMACGTPVIGFDTGGIPEMVRHMQTGLLAKAGNSKDLAENIRWMLDHRKERLKMGENARKIAIQEFSQEIQANRYIKLYQSLKDTSVVSTYAN